MTGKTILKVEDLTIAFGQQKVLDKSNFEVKQGEKYLISGQSGSGKSVFMYALVGLLPVSTVTGGKFSLFIPGRGTVEMTYENYQKCEYITQSFGVVFQDAIHSLHPLRHVIDQVPVDISESERAPKFSRFLLDYHYLSDRRFIRLPSHCSGGECQRLSLLFSSLLENECIFLDEPLTDIDHISRTAVQKAMEEIFNDREKTVILISHDWSWLDVPFRHYVIDKKCLREAASRDESADIFDLGMNLRKIDTVQKRDRITDAVPSVRLTINEPIYFAGNDSFCLKEGEVNIFKGQKLGIVGQSGSGKSSLIRLIAGLGPSRSYHTKLHLEAHSASMELENFRKFGRREWFAQTQVVYQDTTGTFMPDEVLENHFKRIERLRGTDEKFWEALDYWCQKLELFDSEKMDHEPLNSYISQSSRQQFLSKKFDELSMGMRRRTGLLRAFLLLQTFDELKGNSPKLLLLDEVSRGLDAQNRSLMADAISEFSNKFNVSVVSVSHDFGFLSEFCDHVRTMYDGQLLPLEISFGEVLRIRNGDTIEGLDHPYYEQFIRGEENGKNMDNIGI